MTRWRDGIKSRSEEWGGYSIVLLESTGQPSWLQVFGNLFKIHGLACYNETTERFQWSCLVRLSCQMNVKQMF